MNGMQEKREKNVPLDKGTARRRREWYSARRGSWNGVKPVTRVIPSKDLRRARAEQREKDE